MVALALAQGVAGVRYVPSERRKRRWGRTASMSLVARPATDGMPLSPLSVELADEDAMPRTAKPADGA